MYTYIDGHEMNFCVSVLARLRGGHIDDFAGAALDHDVSIQILGLQSIV